MHNVYAMHRTTQRIENIMTHESNELKTNRDIANKLKITNNEQLNVIFEHVRIEYHDTYNHHDNDININDITKLSHVFDATIDELRDNELSLTTHTQRVNDALRDDDATHERRTRIRARRECDNATHNTHELTFKKMLLSCIEMTCESLNDDINDESKMQNFDDMLIRSHVDDIARLNVISMICNTLHNDVLQMIAQNIVNEINDVCNISKHIDTYKLFKRESNN